MFLSLSEAQLKEIFRNRKFDFSLISSTSGKRVEIIQTGEVNSDAGPDFKHALIKIEGVTMRGEIELHKRSSDWYSHNHQTDRNYNGVVLHVVVECDEPRSCQTESGRTIETVELSKFLLPDAQKYLSQRDQLAEERIAPLNCAGKNSVVPFKEKLDYLKLLGEKRFMHKVNKFEERLRDIVDENRPVIFEAKQRYFRDFSELLIEHKTYEKSEMQDENYWDQLLYEGIVEGLGYIKNTAAFRKLARNATLSFLREYSNGEEGIIEAMLFGAAGLLPQMEAGFDDESKTYCEQLVRIWQGIKKKYKREYVDKSEWLFFKLRPQNFPTVRIAGASHFLCEQHGKFSAKELVEQRGTGSNTLANTASENHQNVFPASVNLDLSLWRKTLIVPAEGYWSRHFVFGTLASTNVKMLIGAIRAEEIIINSILPLTYLRGNIFETQALCDVALETYRQHPTTQDNNITLLIKQDLFGGDNVFDTVIAQQGALYIYRSLCSERRCARCKIGRAVFKKSPA
ncbi:MAG: DUF2851 family protein [Candidatus Kryptoniota bacterium]